MALGLAIDDTIHYFSRFSHDAKALADERRATVTALTAVGRPVTYTTLATCLAFLVLAMGDMGSFVQFGALAAFTLAFAWVVDFTLTPSLGAGLRLVTLWDTLTYDLGEDPQRSIPIFAGLSKRQCRKVALMATVRRLQKGQRLIRAGESGREMFVVIDGAVRISIDAPEGPREVTVERRGATVGQVGLFAEVRSMNADVVEDARLLRLTPKNLDRLRRRYPWTAGTVLLNLNVASAHQLLDAATRETKLPGLEGSD